MVDSRRQWPAAPPPSLLLPPVQVDPSTGLGGRRGVIKWPPTLCGKGCARIVCVPACDLHAYTQTEPWPSLSLHCDVSVTDGHAVRRAILSVSNIYQHAQFVMLL